MTSGIHIYRAAQGGGGPVYSRGIGLGHGGDNNVLLDVEWILGTGQTKRNHPPMFVNIFVGDLWEIHRPVSVTR